MNLRDGRHPVLLQQAMRHLIRELRLPVGRCEVITRFNPDSVEFCLHGSETIWRGLGGMKFIDPGRILSVRLTLPELCDLADQMQDLWRDHHLYGYRAPTSEDVAVLLRPKFAGLFLAERLKMIFLGHP